MATKKKTTTKKKTVSKKSQTDNKIEQFQNEIETQPTENKVDDLGVNVTDNVSVSVTAELVKDGKLLPTEEVIMNAEIKEEKKDPKVQILEEFVEYYKKHCEGKTSVKNEIAQVINNYRNAYFGRTERLGNCPACLYKIIKILRKECAKNNISF